MKKNRFEFEKWFDSDNLQIASLAMQYQWKAILSGNQAFFTEDELWEKENRNRIVISGLILAVRQNPDLLPQALDILKKRLNNNKKLPTFVWSELINGASFLLKEEEHKKMILDFVMQQNFNQDELPDVIGSLLICLDKMPLWYNFAFTCINHVSSNREIALLLLVFLQRNRKLEDPSHKLLLNCVEKISAEDAPELIDCLLKTPCSNRYDVALSLFKHHFEKKDLELRIKAICSVFQNEGNLMLQQKLLTGLFFFFTHYEGEIDAKYTYLLVDGAKMFLIKHWADNCYYLGKFWYKFHDDPEFFMILRSALSNDTNLVLKSNWGSCTPLARLKSPLHMLSYIQIFNNTDFCILLLRAVAQGSVENKNLASKILVQNDHNLQCSGDVDAFLPVLQSIFNYEHPMGYEVKRFGSAILNSLIEFGSVSNISELYDFVQCYNLDVPAFKERYDQELEELLAKRRYEREVLDFLLH